MAEQVEVPLLRGLIGRALRRRRLAQQRTLRDVAAAALVSMPYLSEIERGRKEASSEILAAICRALGVRLTDLLDEVRLELARVEPEIAPTAPATPPAEVGRPVTARLGVAPPRRRSRPFEPRATAGGPAGVGGPLAVDAAAAWDGDGPTAGAALGSPAYQHGVSPNLGLSAGFEAVLGAGRVVVPAGTRAARRSSHRLAAGAIRAARRGCPAPAGRSCPPVVPRRPAGRVGRTTRRSARVCSAG
ncbi:helix-turn-helix domain-containing protein [Frankia sp. QA3]|uniref:helix-turn-helix domain-containing protein n=1 Tax=Frankia sp. QA3 TaxID=710111 RepID=UPI000A06E121|nr:helix-turn-helix transcriptional regulator [Frankia sp. QA3]